MIQNAKIAVIGPGVMGKAIIASLVEKAQVDPQHIRVGGPNPERLALLAETYQVLVYADNGQAVQDAEVVILAVKPQRLIQAAKSIKPMLPAVIRRWRGWAAGLAASLAQSLRWTADGWTPKPVIKLRALCAFVTALISLSSRGLILRAWLCRMRTSRAW